MPTLPVILAVELTANVPVEVTVIVTLEAEIFPPYTGRYCATCVFPYVGAKALMPLAQNKLLVTMMLAVVILPPKVTPVLPVMVLPLITTLPMVSPLLQLVTPLGPT